MLTEVYIPSTKYTPEVILLPEGTIKIKGRGLTVNKIDIPDQIIEWIEAYILDPAESTTIEICFEYLNSFSSTILVSIIKRISLIMLKGKKLIINWYYEDDDDDVYERGECISSSISIPFNFIQIP